MPAKMFAAFFLLFLILLFSGCSRDENVEGGQYGA
jgi:hypothetical protein